MKTIQARMMLVVAMLCSVMVRAGQLNGSYTIDPGQSASTTNFKDFQSAIIYMTSSGARPDGGDTNSGTFGVSGPVIFMVAPATYSVSAAISIPNIPGASPVNTVTFDGGTGNAAGRIISGSLSTPVVIFNACKYVSVKNLTIKNTSTNGGGVCFYNSMVPASTTSPAAAGSCNSISNCIVTIANQSSGINIGITGNMSGTSLSTCYADSIQIDSNACNGGNYGIAMNGGSNPNYNRGIRIRGNNVVNIYMYGIYMYYTINEVHILNNTIKMDPSYGYMGMYVYAYNTILGASPYKIIRNKVTNYAYYGMYLSYMNGSQTNPCRIYNNMVTSTSPSYSPYYDIYNYNYSGSYTEVFHNTAVHNINANAGSASYAALYSAGSANVTIKNNLFVNLAGGSANAIYLGTSPTGNSVNYNNYYSTGSNLMYRAAQYSAATYQTVTAGGDSSFNANPNFIDIANSDMHLANACGPKAPWIATVPIDIDGETRLTSLTMVGADEATSQPNDISVLKILSPTAPITLGLQDIIVKVKNTGTNPINNFDLTYIHNANLPVTYSWTGILLPCEETTVTFTGSKQVNLGLTNNLVVFSGSPNSNPDGNRSNDTARTILYAPLNGNYIIGSSPSANFSSFADAILALQSGMSGPVNITVEPGDYNESVVLNTPVGLSAINPLSFDGGAAATTSITTSSNVAVVLNQCKYVTLKNLTINANGQYGVAIVGNSSNNKGSCNTIKKCVINFTGTSGYGMMISGSATNSYTASHIDSTWIDSCQVNNGGYGIWFYGDNSNNIYCINNRFTNNIINGAYNYGIYASAAGGTVIDHNKVNMSTAYAYNYGIYFQGGTYLPIGSIYVYKGPKVANVFTNNQVSAGYMGLYLTNTLGSINKPTLVSNNMINMNGAAYYGLYMYSYQYYLSSSDPTPTVRVYHNTININTTNSYCYGLYYTYYGYNGANDAKAEIKNNILSVTGASASILPAYIYYSSSGGTSFPPVLDYNLYYNAASPNLLQVQGANYNASNFNLTTSGGMNSINVKPPFISASNLHLSNACYKGTNLATWVPKDMDGDVRSITPNLGADEYQTTSLDIALEAIIAPVLPVQAGYTDVKVVVRNNGYTILNSFSVNYALNGSSPVTQTLTRTLNPCDTAVLVFTGSQQLNIPEGQNTLQVYTSLPNALPDLHTSNDTIAVLLVTPLAGDYVIGNPPSDFPNFTEAIKMLNLGGVKGHTRFHVKAGVYNENLSWQNVSGVSDTSTILFHSMDENPDSVKIIASKDYVFNMRNISYTTFRNLSFIQTASNSNGGVINFSGTCTNDTVIFCKFSMPLGYSGNQVNAYPANLYNFTLKRNTFTGGGYWINQQSATTTTPSAYSSMIIDSNVVTQSYYLVYSYFTKDMKIRYNNITLDDYSTYSQFYVMYPHCVNSYYELSNNNLNRLATSTSNSYSFYYYPFYYCNYSLSAAPATNAMVYNNVLNLYSPASNGYVYGSMYTYYTNWTNYFNNKIMIQDDTTGNSQFGISLYYTKYFNAYNNTFPLGIGNFQYYTYSSPGNRFVNNTVTSKYKNGYAMVVNGIAADMVFKNNIIINNSASYGSLSATSIPASATWDYNNIYNKDVGNVVNTYSNLAAWKLASGKDKNSLSYNPGLYNWNRHLKPNPDSSSVWSVNGRAMPDSMVTTDINGASRSVNVVTGATDLGAYEITPASTPPIAVASPSTPAAGTTQSFLFGKDTIAKITWDPSALVPSTITVQLYSGVNPPAVSAGSMMNAYWDVQASSTSTYALSLYHKGNMVGSNPNKANMIGAQRTIVPTIWQFIYVTNSDTANNILNLNGLISYGQFTGTDQTTPFTGLTPPIFFDLHAKNVGTDVAVSWNTELNKDLINKGRYVVERSFDAKNFSSVGQVNITSDYNYSFIDQGAVAQAPANMIYYRLKTLTNDGSELNNGTAEYSKVALVNLDDQGVYPNPFSNSISVNITRMKAGEVQMNVKDISGRVLVSQSRTASMGSTTVNVDQLGELKPGVYFLTVDSEGTSQVYKIIKN